MSWLAEDGVGITADLAAFVAEAQYEDIPAEVLERGRTLILDALAAGFVGAQQPWTNVVEDLVADMGGAASASVFGRRDRVSLSQAALLNGVMISGFEGDGGGHQAHPPATVTPAALALGERARLPGRDLLVAWVLAAEAACRIGHAQTRSVEDQRGFHNPGVNGPLAAAAAAGRLIGLGAEAQANALGIAGSHSAGLIEYVWDGAMTKRLHLGRAAQHGLESALLASKGFTGPVTIIEGRSGLLHAFSPTPKPEVVLSGLGSEWCMQAIKTKLYALHGTGQSLVWAVQQLKRAHAVDPTTVERVAIRSTDHRVTEERFLERAPRTMLGAQCSLPFTVAVALARDLENPLQYDETTLSDQTIRRIAELIQLDMIEDAASFRVELEVAMNGQRASTVVGPYRGSTENPSSFADVEDKFHRFSAHLLDEDRRKRIVDAIRRLDDLDDVSELAGMLRAPA